MKTVIIPDIHHHISQVKLILLHEAPDKVVFLGDWFDDFFDTPEMSADTAIWLMKRMDRHPEDVFIWGNHDKQMRHLKDRWREWEHKITFLPPLAETDVNGQQIILCHYAMRVWNKSHRGSWHLYGHSHSTLPDEPASMSFDVGVDAHAYHPLRFNEVAALMAKKSWKPIDHHGS